MQAVILTGGLGTRLRPVTSSLPKGLVPFNGRPFLEYLLEYLKRFGIRDVLLCTGYLGKQIEKHFRDGKELGLRIEYSLEKKPLGTGGALKLAWGRVQDEFYLLNGDTLLPGDWQRLRELAAKIAADMVLSVVPVSLHVPVGNLRLGTGGRVTAYSKAAADETFGHVDAGVSYVHRRIARYFPEKEIFSLENEVYPSLVAAGRLGAMALGETFYDIGTPEGLLSFGKFIKKQGLSGGELNSQIGPT